HGSRQPRHPQPRARRLLRRVHPLAATGQRLQPRSAHAGDRAGRQEHRQGDREGHPRDRPRLQPEQSGRQHLHHRPTAERRAPPRPRQDGAQHGGGSQGGGAQHPPRRQRRTEDDEERRRHQRGRPPPRRGRGPEDHRRVHPQDRRARQDERVRHPGRVSRPPPEPASGAQARDRGAPNDDARRSSGTSNDATRRAGTSPEAAARGGPKAPSGWRRHRTRVLSACALFGAALLVLWVGLPLLAPAYLVLTLVALQEYATLMNLRGIPIRKRSLWVAAVLTLPASLPVNYPGMEPLIAGVSWREALIALFALYLVGLELANPNRNSLQAVVFTLFGYLYIP